jgi:hypothetical protein
MSKIATKILNLCTSSRIRRMAGVQAHGHYLAGREQHFLAHAIVGVGHRAQIESKKAFIIKPAAIRKSG